VPDARGDGGREPVNLPHIVEQLDLTGHGDDQRHQCVEDFRHRNEKDGRVPVAAFVHNGLGDPSLQQAARKALKYEVQGQWLRPTNVWRRVTSPARGAKRLRSRTANERVSTGRASVLAVSHKQMSCNPAAQ
jgi:hypothetical protein